MMRPNSNVCVKMKCDGAYQLSMLMSIYNNEIWTHSLELICLYRVLILAMYILYVLRYLKKKVGCRFRSFVQYSYIVAWAIYTTHIDKFAPTAQQPAY